MGTALGALFIIAAAAIGLFVGTRPTLIDGRQIAAEMEKSVKDRGITVSCDRRIRLGASGAEFTCTQYLLGESQRVRFRMTREGKYGPVGMGL